MLSVSRSKETLFGLKKALFLGLPLLFDLGEGQGGQRRVQLLLGRQVYLL